VEVPIDRSGAVVDAAVKAGADGVSGPSLTVSAEDALYDAALKKALANARDKAATIAGAAGMTLGPVQTVVEGSAPGPVAWGAAAITHDSTQITVEPGTQETDATVTVTYSAS
ncbi:MAG TPA: SIMPL domain-containing protein, partial [Gaiellaceae bacterium]|nr:SIMPL domain-containing protein [Gaiellaceae bacterium]